MRQLDKPYQKKPALTRVQRPTQPTMFVTRDLDLWPFDPKIHGFPGCIVEYFCVKFGDPSYIGFWDVVWKNGDTGKQELKTLPNPSMGNNMSLTVAGSGVGDCDATSTVPRSQSQAAEAVSADDVVRLWALGLAWSHCGTNAERLYSPVNDKIALHAPPLYRPDLVSRRAQLTTGGLCWSEVLLSACSCAIRLESRLPMPSAYISCVIG